MTPTKINRFKPYDTIEIELKDYNSDKYVTYKGYFLRYNKEDKAIIQINSVILTVDINRVRKVNND